MLLTDEARQEQVERILQSETFHSAGALRRLLRFLADKAFSGEADDLNEYAIGVDALGKPPSYDPRRDSIVRLQIGRLRQKLGEYYRSEGKDDPVVFEVPKGRFKLKWEMRVTVPPEPLQVAVSTPVMPNETGQRRHLAWALLAALIFAIAWGGYSTALLWRARASQMQSVIWTPELEQLWQPLIASKRPLVIAIADPLFVGFTGTDVFVRRISLRTMEEAAASPEIGTFRKMLGNAPIQARFSFMPTGEVMSSFLLGKLLGTRKQNISLERGREVLVRGLADNDTILIGPEIMFEQKLMSGVQLHPDLAPAPGGIRNLYPRKGEPAFFADVSSVASPEDGEVYALISRAPGPLGGASFLSFTSSRTWGRLGAVQAFTDPSLARTLLERIKTPSGEIPRSYQIVLNVRFKDGTPVGVSYVMHRSFAVTS